MGEEKWMRDQSEMGKVEFEEGREERRKGEEGGSRGEEVEGERGVRGQ